MLQPIARPASTQWTVTYPALVAPRPLRPSHSYHPYHPPTGRTSAARHSRPPRLRMVPSPAEALSRISLVDQPTPPPDVPDEASPSREFGTVSTLSSETLEEFLRILRKDGGDASPVQSPETDAHPVILSCVVKASASPTDCESKRNPLTSAPAAWDSRASNTPDDSTTPEPVPPMTAPVIVPDWAARPRSGAIRKRTRTQSHSPTRDHTRWSHPYRRDTAPHSRNGSEKSSRHSRDSSFGESSRPCTRSASKRASATSWASSETDVSEAADLGSSQHEDVDVEIASNCGDVDDEEFQARSADTELDSSTCGDGPKPHSRGRMLRTPASPISRRHTSNPLAHYSPVLFETLAARARANAFSPSHSRSPSPSPAPVADPLDEDDADDVDEYQPPRVVRMEMPRSLSSSP
ncbi:hypothetical protein RhiLY_02734 [Ceratobasidium sp. AG-Ba]|nr:hypothetical protein RhiLY_02734 [Ceratobasidium sp. AG-Ba]